VENSFSGLTHLYTFVSFKFRLFMEIILSSLRRTRSLKFIVSFPLYPELIPYKGSSRLRQVERPQKPIQIQLWEVAPHGKEIISCKFQFCPWITQRYWQTSINFDKSNIVSCHFNRYFEAIFFVDRGSSAPGPENELLFKGDTTWGTRWFVPWK
jgi:hypothetical protein